MAYFHCLIGGGSSGGGYELTVTCDADFAGTTITCTDGVTTLTQTCPSASPYEVVFEIPNGGDWTISGVTGGRTVSTGVNIPTSAELIATIQQTVTIYSAKEDTISYTDIDGATQTITFASGETSKQVTIAIESNGSAITFTSGVAKDPSNLSNDYSKTVTITSNTTDVYVMPDNALYWWGYMSDDCEECTTANGWTYSGYTFASPTYNTHDILLNAPSTKYSAIGNKNAMSGTPKVIAKGVTAAGSIYGQIIDANNKVISSYTEYVTFDSNNTKTYSLNNSISNSYVDVAIINGRASNVYAFWIE